jgi:hypothetical protein
MKTASAKPAFAQERCQYRTTTGRQCASRIVGPGFSYCPRHSYAQPQPLAPQPPAAQRMEAQPSDFQDFATLLTENASDFQDPQGINNSLAALYKLLASGQISPRRATGLAYIASLLLRTLPDIRESYPYALRPSGVPARGRVGMPPDEEPPTPPEFQPPVTPAPSLQGIVPPVPPPNFPDLPAVVRQPFPPASSVVWSGPEYSRSPVRSVPLFRRARPSHSWKPRFSAEAARAVHRPRVCEVQLAPLQLQLPRLNHPRRQTHRLDVLQPTSTVGPNELTKVEMNRKDRWKSPRGKPQRKAPENPLQVRIIRSAELRGGRRGWRGGLGYRMQEARRLRAGRRRRRRSRGLWR